MLQTIITMKLPSTFPRRQHYDSVYAQRGDADWLTGKEVAEGAKDGTVENYYKIQQDNFIKAGAVEKEVPVADYVMLDNMIEAGK